eukprot:7062343-Ditylum_brightwellii.AAC.1
MELLSRKHLVYVSYPYNSWDLYHSLLYDPTKDPLNQTFLPFLFHSPFQLQQPTLELLPSFFFRHHFYKQIMFPMHVIGRKQMLQQNKKGRGRK